MSWRRWILAIFSLSIVGCSTEATLSVADLRARYVGHYKEGHYEWVDHRDEQRYGPADREDTGGKLLVRSDGTYQYIVQSIRNDVEIREDESGLWSVKGSMIEFTLVDSPVGSKGVLRGLYKLADRKLKPVPHDRSLWFRKVSDSIDEQTKPAQ